MNEEKPWFVRHPDHDRVGAVGPGESPPVPAKPGWERLGINLLQVRPIGAVANPIAPCVAACAQRRLHRHLNAKHGNLCSND